MESVIEPLKVVRVKDLMEYLSNFPEDLPVAYRIYSECSLLQLTDIDVCKMQPWRNDGWIHTFRRNEDAETVSYLLFPGN